METLVIRGSHTSGYSAKYETNVCRQMESSRLDRTAAGARAADIGRCSACERLRTAAAGLVVESDSD